jgi:hypothetical protein
MSRQAATIGAFSRGVAQSHLQYQQLKLKKACISPRKPFFAITEPCQEKIRVKPLRLLLPLLAI